MGSQSGFFNKTGLGFDNTKTQKLYKNLFIPDKKEMKVKCSFCKKIGHLESICFQKKKLEHKFYNEPKRYRHTEKFLKQSFYKDNLQENDCKIVKTNPQGPKMIWVPKVSKNQNAGTLSRNKEKAMVFGQWLFKTHDRR